MASGVGIPRCQQQRILGSSGSYWTHQVFKPHCQRGLHCTYVYIRFHLWTCILLIQREEQDAAAVAVCACVSALHAYLICVASHMCIYTCGVHLCLSFTTGWTWGHGAVASLPLLGYQAWQPLKNTS